MLSENNPHGIKLKLGIKDNQIFGKFTPRKEHQGYEGITHGGIICSILDESLVWTPKLLNKNIAVTVELNVRFLKPAIIGEKLIIIASIDKDRGKIFESSSKIQREDGTIVAKASGKLMLMPEEKSQELLKNLVEQ